MAAAASAADRGTLVVLRTRTSDVKFRDFWREIFHEIFREIFLKYFKNFTMNYGCRLHSSLHSCSERAKRTLFFAKSARTLTHFIL